MTTIIFNDSSYNYKFSASELKSPSGEELYLYGRDVSGLVKVGNSFVKFPVGTTTERPFSTGGTENGYLRFNTTTLNFETFNVLGNSWVQLPASPVISSLQPSIIDVSTNFIDTSTNIFGANFGSSLPNITFIGTDNSRYSATSVTSVPGFNINQAVTAVFPTTLIDNSNVEPFRVEVQNTSSSLIGVSKNPIVITFNDVPRFTNFIFPGGYYADISNTILDVQNGFDTSYNVSDSGILDLSFVDLGHLPSEVTVTSSNINGIQSGKLTLNSDGTIDGSLNNPGTTTTYAFTATATDTSGGVFNQNFNFKYTVLEEVVYNIATLTTSDYTVTYADTLTGTGNTRLTVPYTNGTGSTIIAFRDPSTTAPGSTKTGTITFLNNLASTIPVEYLVVAGGGCTYSIAGASGGVGGGGAGGMRTGTLNLVNATSYTVSVGAGASTGTPVTRGVDSTFATISSTGGGSAEQTTYSAAIQDGGSGAGEGYGSNSPQYNNNGPGNAGGYSPSEGNAGGNGGGTGAAGTGIGGGGGGAGQAGDTNGVGHGGDGAQSSITGQAVYYAGGGGSQFDNDSPGSGVSTPGGLGGGGDGASSTSSPLNAQAGTNGLGGGGGGMWNSYDAAGAAGGSGIIVIRFPSYVAI
jgi:hypothetical protein